MRAAVAITGCFVLMCAGPSLARQGAAKSSLQRSGLHSHIVPADSTPEKQLTGTYVAVHLAASSSRHLSLSRLTESVSALLVRPFTFRTLCIQTQSPLIRTLNLFQVHCADVHGLMMSMR